MKLHWFGWWCRLFPCSFRGVLTLRPYGFKGQCWRCGKGVFRPWELL